MNSLPGNEFSDIVGSGSGTSGVSAGYMYDFPSNLSTGSNSSAAGGGAGAFPSFDFPSNSSVTSENGSTDCRSDAEENFSDLGNFHLRGKVGSVSL